MAPGPFRLFAYGSLMQGERDHALVASAEFVGRVTTEPKYKLVDVGPYPALITGGTLAVEGELYVVDAKQRFATDVKYECPVLFHRIAVALEDGTTADAYAMREDQVRGKRRLFYGDWRKRFQPRPRSESVGGPLVRAARERFKPLK
jgi:gamma-glutamylaminecyclotransferase